ncbi:hypothetical protein PYW07_002236 [Mythimna separata]|uniref:Breast cancer type 1 susceptibility protein-like n=1 Tax=Mythimna separata TaxID=271217 RepID=A0AAD7YMG8_MYTSE|nr:hypothetical protein PYW07_002236 [Mythimna separata]
MNLKDLDLTRLSKLTSQQIDHVTCLECCKYFIAPATAACGHTLCHTCWRGRRTCPACATQLERKTLKLNIPLQTLTDHVQVLGEAFEKLFNIKLDEFNLDTPGEIDSEKDPDKNVKDWLTSSQNHFSAAIQNSETFSQESQQPANPLEISASNIIIHTDTKKVVTPSKVVYVPPPQDDWDKIETMPDTEVTTKKNENIVGPMDIEPFFVEDSEYTTDHPRRSSRKRDLKSDNIPVKVNDLSPNMHSSRDSSGDNDKKSLKAKQNWNNVKKMRKEFSKLNKKNRSKLNVSIEMAKKTQNLKPAINTPVAAPHAYNIDDNTPDYTNKENEANIINSKEPIDKENDNANQNIAAKSIEKENRDIAKDTDSESEKNHLEDSQNKMNVNDDVIQEDSRIIKENENFTSLDNSQNINQNHTQTVNKMPFIRKSALNPKTTDNFDVITNHNYVQPVASENSDDIEITIKVGSTITNIVIKKKQNVQVKINTDREVQTSLDPHHSDKNNDLVVKDINNHNVDINIENNRTKVTEPVIVNINESQNVQKSGPNIIENKNLHVVDNMNKTTSVKKNTASADTATAQFEITESVEKELSNLMECDVIQDKEKSPKSISTKVQQVKEQNANKTVEEQENIDELHDLDIFNSGSVKEANVHVLRDHAPSEILGTVQSKYRTQKLAEKRNRDNEDEVLPVNKKTKMNPEENVKPQEMQAPDSEPINYDAIMGQVFASIDADIEDIRKSQEVESASILKDRSAKNNQEPAPNKRIPSQMQKTQTIKKVASQIDVEITPNLNEYFNERHSENVFSIVEKEDENSELNKTGKVPQQVEELLTPVLCHNLNSTQESNDGIIKTNKTKKSQDYDDDKSVVEETPQKNLSIPKLKRASTLNQSQISLIETNKSSRRKSTSTVKSIINLTDTVTESNKSTRDVTVIETAIQNQVLETPLTITKFADQIKHKSTPMVRKSLNFENRNDDEDPEQTLCPTDVIAKTTQEREFMCKAFERTPTTPAARPLASRNLGLNNRRYCLAASCLTSSEISKVKALCADRKWRHVDKYSKDITHLIVGVDEENKSQRSVKYMCALAASKWIVSFDWVKQCLLAKEIVNEEPFEALDSTGEPGPRRSRMAKQKLFEGITFYCMPPFSVLDLETLKNMLLAAGGRVAADPSLVRISEDSYQPALVLAEPERTQEDRFTYLAMEQSIVPVNYEWVLNCLGNYTLGSIQELLLCPSSLLPPATAKWPEVLLSQDYDDTNDII